MFELSNVCGSGQSSYRTSTVNTAKLRNKNIEKLEPT